MNLIPGLKKILKKNTNLTTTSQLLTADRRQGKYKGRVKRQHRWPEKDQVAESGVRVKTPEVPIHA